MFARAEEGTKVSLLHDMLREERAGRWKEGRIVREVLAMSKASNCCSSPAKRDGETTLIGLWARERWRREGEEEKALSSIW